MLNNYTNEIVLTQIINVCAGGNWDVSILLMKNLADKEFSST